MSVINGMPIIDSFGCKVCSLIHVLMLGAAEDLTCLLCEKIHALPRKEASSELLTVRAQLETRTTQTSDHSDSEWNGIVQKRPKRPRPSKEKRKKEKEVAQEPAIKRKKKSEKTAPESSLLKTWKEAKEKLPKKNGEKKQKKERKASNEEHIPRALTRLIDGDKPRKKKKSFEGPKPPTTRSSKSEKRKRKLPVRAKRKKSKPSESEKPNEANSNETEETDEDETEFHDEKRCFTCRKTFSRMSEDLVHVLCDSCQHWICGNCAPEAADISAKDVYTCESCVRKKEKGKSLKDEKIRNEELIMFCSNTWCSYELSLADKLKGKTSLTEKTRASQIEQLTTLVNKHEVTCTKNFKLNKRMKRNEMGRVQYVDIDKEGLDPKVSGSMVSKRILEDSMPYIKMERINHEYEQQMEKIKSPPIAEPSPHDFDDLSDSSDEQEFSDDF